MARPAKVIFFDLGETLVTQNIEDNDQLVNRAIEIIVKARAANGVAFDDAHSTIQRLARRDVKLGIISNVSSHEVAMGILDKVRLTRYFDEIVTSAMVGIRKPDPGIFRYALMQFRARPEEAVMVGDSEIHDIGGGYISGLKTVLVDRRHRVENTLADHHFSSLRDASRELESQ